MLFILHIGLFFLTFCLNAKEPVVTNPKQHDGFGSQFQSIIAAVVYAELAEKKFAYRPFEKMDHNYNNDRCFLRRKELLINFNGNFERFDKNKHISNESINFKEFFDWSTITCAKSNALKKIKNIFRANKKRNFFKNENINIAIHIRRFNPHDNRTEGSNIPLSFYISVINKLRYFYTLLPLTIHIYSQGTRTDFEKLFTGEDIVLHINNSVEETFTGMVFADILIIAASSLSYTAGLLSEGIVYYIPFWHQPMPDWISINDFLMA